MADAHSAASPTLAARNVFKGFFGNPVLRGVSIELRPGRIHALLGENGAGKSTLINLLSGALVPDSGTIEIDGRAVSRHSPADAARAGIAVVQQELSLTASLSIAENVGLGAFPTRWGLVDYPALSRRVAEVCELVGLREPLSTPVGDLPLGRRQMVEIAKAVFRRPRVLILDEPTSSLSAGEAAVLSGLLQRLRGEGTAILYISHRLNEVLALCEHVTVLKDGTVTADRSLAGIDGAGLVRLMVGRDPGGLFPPWTPAPGPVAVSLRNFSAGAMRDVSLDICRGEVLGVGGLVGQGQEDLLLGLYGEIPSNGGGSLGEGTRLPANVQAANRLGLAYVPADRKREGLHLSHSIRANLLLPGFGRMAGLKVRRQSEERSLTAQLASRLGIKGDLGRAAQALSGGNQQKVALAKWLPHDPSVLLLNDPTRGVDVETKREIYAMLRGFAAAGKAVVLLSSDTPELVHLADRVVVVREGRVAAILAQGELSEERIVGAAMGAIEAGGAAA